MVLSVGTRDLLLRGLFIEGRFNEGAGLHFFFFKFELLGGTDVFSGSNNEKILDLIKEKSDENVTDVVAPREKQTVEIFLREYFLNNGRSLVNREVM
jgi:hypothetical protein